MCVLLQLYFRDTLDATTLPQMYLDWTDAIQILPVRIIKESCFPHVVLFHAFVDPGYSYSCAGINGLALLSCTF
jgi:hypothetical protein